MYIIGRSVMYNIIKSISRPKCNICVFDLDSSRIDAVSAMQKFVLHARKFSSDSIEMKRTVFKNILGNLTDRMDYNIVFDETIWLPTRPNDYGKLLRLTIKPTRVVELFIFDVHFGRKINDCVRMVGDAGRTLWFDIFSPVFRSEEELDKPLPKKTEIEEGVRKLDL